MPELEVEEAEEVAAEERSLLATAEARETDLSEESEEVEPAGEAEITREEVEVVVEDRINGTRATRPETTRRTRSPGSRRVSCPPSSSSRPALGSCPAVSPAGEAGVRAG